MRVNCSKDASSLHSDGKRDNNVYHFETEDDIESSLSNGIKESKYNDFENKNIRELRNIKKKSFFFLSSLRRAIEPELYESHCKLHDEIKKLYFNKIDNDSKYILHEKVENLLLNLNDPIGGYSVQFEEFVPEIDRLNGKWLKITNSVYGIVIAHLLMFAELKPSVLFRGAFFCLQQMIPVAIAQILITYKLFMSLPDLQGSSFCASNQSPTDMLFTFSIIFVFVVSSASTLFEMEDEFEIAISARIYFRYNITDGKAVIRPLRRSMLGVGCALFIVFIQLCIWCFVFITGVWYIITSEDVSSIVQAALAMEFINHIDNMALFLFEREKELSEKGYFRTRSDNEGAVIAMEERRYFTFFSAMPALLVGVSVALVLGLYASYC